MNNPSGKWEPSSPGAPRTKRKTLASQVFGPGGANTIPVLVVVKVGLVVTLRT